MNKDYCNQAFGIVIFSTPFIKWLSILAALTEAGRVMVKAEFFEPLLTPKYPALAGILFLVQSSTDGHLAVFQLDIHVVVLCAWQIDVNDKAVFFLLDVNSGSEVARIEQAVKV